MTAEVQLAMRAVVPALAVALGAARRKLGVGAIAPSVKIEAPWRLA
jgi:hypothetical protein